MLVLTGETPLLGFLSGLACGLIFFIGLFDWILEVKGYTYLHHALLAIYLGSYLGYFGALYSFVSTRIGPNAGLLYAPFIWTSIEYFRSNASILELPWGLLAHSQYSQHNLIQISSLFGPWGVSFLLVFVNSAIAGILMVIFEWHKYGKLSKIKLKISNTLLIPVFSIIFVLCALIYGNASKLKSIEGVPIRLAVVQGSIDQRQKWDPAYARQIMQTYGKITIEAAQSRPDLIIWPESATPASVSQNLRLMQEIQAMAANTGIPILFGSSHSPKFAYRQLAEGKKVFNSAFLINPITGVENHQKYDKIRLFPFGEYLPLKETIPWSWIGVAAFAGYFPGNEYKLFDLKGVRFAATICWENLFPDLVRQFVIVGAKFIINITNEAWFGETAAPEQFLSMNVFRAVENGVYVVRCGNTGISCFIDPFGRVLQLSAKDGKNIFVSGYLTSDVVPSSKTTLYTRYGDWFPWLCVIISITYTFVAAVKFKL